jgi:hypothetical protein
MTNPVSKISSGLFDSIIHMLTTKEGLSIFFLILSIFILILWISNTIKKNGGIITLISFMITFFMCWITWAQCN